MTVRELRRRRRLPGPTIAPLAIAGFTVMSLAGTALTPVLLPAMPLLAVVLCPRLPTLLLVAGRVPAPLFFAVALLRLVAADPFHFSIGRRHGRRAVDRLPKRAVALVGRAGPLAVFASPTGKVLAAAGATGVCPRATAVADVAGTLARLSLTWMAGTAAF